jgi:BASS family bile acid:Na+ symporter
VKVSGIFFAVLALALLGGWKEIVDLIGSRTTLAALVLAVLALSLGTLAAVGPSKMRTTVGMFAPNRNAGPIFAAVGIAFANAPAILGATTAIMLIGTVVSILFASFLARKRGVTGDVPASTAGAPGTDESAGIDVEL